MLQRYHELNQAMLLAMVLITLGFTGCNKEPADDAAAVQKPPKPVSTMTLRRSSPSFARQTSATVAPWKAERIGFEQSGRVVEVIEPNEKVIARSIATGSQDLENGTVLARLDDERLRIALQTANADLEVAHRRIETNRVAIEQRLPAGIEAAEAEMQLAEKELDRAKRLTGVISQSEQDTIRTRASTARLRVDSAKAELAQAEAQQQALKAQLEQARQRISEVKRNLRNTILYSSFPGQVAEVHAVPGTFAEAGTPIVTVLMMDPMVVEFEVTAEASRRYQRGDSLNVAVADQHGGQRSLTGMVYTVDSVADPSTRTFTVTLHVRNRKESISDRASETTIAKTQSISPLNVGPMVTGDDRLLVDQEAIHVIDGKQYIWKITNRAADEASSVVDRVLKVQRLEVRTVGDAIPFLGKWNYVAIEFVDPSTVDIQRDLITGKLFFSSATSESMSIQEWTGNEVLLEDLQWTLRAGDIVRVSLPPENSAQGYYVPMKAIRRENEQSFVHVVDNSQSESIVRRIRINALNQSAASGESVQLSIEPAEPGDLKEGMQIVVGGTHFLNDGDRVRVVPDSEAPR